MKFKIGSKYATGHRKVKCFNCGLVHIVEYRQESLKCLKCKALIVKDYSLQLKKPLKPIKNHIKCNRLNKTEIKKLISDYWDKKNTLT